MLRTHKQKTTQALKGSQRTKIQFHSRLEDLLARGFITITFATINQKDVNLYIFY